MWVDVVSDVMSEDYISVVPPRRFKHHARKRIWRHVRRGRSAILRIIRSADVDWLESAVLFLSRFAFRVLHGVFFFPVITKPA